MIEIMKYLLEGTPEIEYPTIKSILKLDDEQLEYEIGCWEVEIHEHDKLI